jgi:hypothetical protein
MVELNSRELRDSAGNVITDGFYRSNVYGCGVVSVVDEALYSEFISTGRRLVTHQGQGQTIASNTITRMVPKQNRVGAGN